MQILLRLFDDFALSTESDSARRRSALIQSNKHNLAHTEEFRHETVKLLESSGKSVAELAREMGINEKSLYRWRKQYGADMSEGRNGTSSSSVGELEAELKRLRRELEVVRQERGILRKAIIIFSRSQP